MRADLDPTQPITLEESPVGSTMIHYYFRFERKSIIIFNMAIKLVIVDDAPFIREVVKNLAEETPIDVVGEAGEGEAAIEMARLTHPDIILMDIVMPNMNGVDSSRIICKEFPDIKVIACSALDEQIIREQVKRAGCHSYLLKPFSREELLGAIHRAMETK